MQQAGRGLELLVLEQPTHQRIARIFGDVLVACRRLRARQQHFRLDVDKGCGHHQKLAGEIEIQLLHQLDRFEVLCGDERDGDIVDVQLVFLDEVKQQIERTLEAVKSDGESVRSGFEFAGVVHHLGHR